MSFLMTAYKGRTQDFTVNLYEADGETSITMEATDEVRCKIYRRDAATPVLDLDSVGATASGSVVTIVALGASPVASVTVRIAQGDTSGLEPGVWSAEIDVVDDSETAPANAIKHVESGTFHLLGSGGGDVGLT